MLGLVYTLGLTPERLMFTGTLVALALCSWVHEPWRKRGGAAQSVAPTPVSPGVPRQFQAQMTITSLGWLALSLLVWALRAKQIDHQTLLTYGLWGVVLVSVVASLRAIRSFSILRRLSPDGATLTPSSAQAQAINAWTVMVVSPSGVALIVLEVAGCLTLGIAFWTEMSIAAVATLLIGATHILAQQAGDRPLW